jgi:hypothetical protein
MKNAGTTTIILYLRKCVYMYIKGTPDVDLGILSDLCPRIVA